MTQGDRFAQMLTGDGVALAGEEWQDKTIPVAERVSVAALQALKIDVRIDVSPNNPYSKFAQEQALQNLLQMQLITFEDYVEALDDDSAAPKAKLKEILQKQKLRQSAQTQAQMMGNQAQMAQMARMQAAQQPMGEATGASEEDAGRMVQMIEQLMAENAEISGRGIIKGEE